MIVVVDGRVRGGRVDLLHAAAGAVIDDGFAGVALEGVGTASFEELHLLFIIYSHLTTLLGLVVLRGRKGMIGMWAMRLR